MFSKLVLFILVALLVVPVMAQYQADTTFKGYLSGPWGKKKLSPEETLALQKAREKLEEAKKYDPSRASEAFKELRDLMREISGQAAKKPSAEIPFRDGSGVPYEGVRGQEMPPQLVIDTISFFDGVAVFALNTQRGRGRSRLVAKSEDDIRILSIYNVDVDSTVISRTLDTIKVYSASTADNSRANIMLMVQ